MTLAVQAGVRAMNGLGRTLRRLGLEPASLDETALIEAARRETGLDDFGPDDVWHPLRVLVGSLERDARLSWLGRIVARHDLRSILVNRLRLVRDRAMYPEISAARIERPIFVAGLPRTGSTLLHHLLAQDPGSRVMRAWEVIAPSPPPSPSGEGTDPRIAAARRDLRWFDLIAPEFGAIHPVEAELPLECMAVMAHSLVSARFNTTYRVPTYQAWFDQQDPRPTYELHRAILQHLQARFGSARWVLKAPTHLWTLDTLFAVYPDALVVQTHRDPVTVLSSVASMTAALRGVFAEAVDPLEIGPEVTHQWSQGLERALQFRRSGAVAADRFVDVHYRDLLRDPLAAVRTIYDRGGRALGAEAERRIRAHLASHPQDRRGRHRYSPASFGLYPDAIAHRFKTYREYFDVEQEVLP